MSAAVFAMERNAVISACGLYRYELTRRWAPGPMACFVMLNPSTADADREDATSRRVQAFARAWGYSGLRIVNAYGYRATDPTELWSAADPVGPRNDYFLARAARIAQLADSPLVAAWGANAKPGRTAEVLALPDMDRLTALALTKDGQPRHPLYLRADLTPQPWKPARQPKGCR